MFAVFLVITAAAVVEDLGSNQLYVPMPSMKFCEFIVENSVVDKDSELLYGMTCIQTEESYS